MDLPGILIGLLLPLFLLWSLISAAVAWGVHRLVKDEVDPGAGSSPEVRFLFAATGAAGGGLFSAAIVAPSVTLGAGLAVTLSPVLVSVAAGMLLGAVFASTLLVVAF